MAAHKRLLKEKEALEVSLKVMSRASSTVELGNEDCDAVSTDSGQTQSSDKVQDRLLFLYNYSETFK